MKRKNTQLINTNSILFFLFDTQNIIKYFDTNNYIKFKFINKYINNIFNKFKLDFYWNINSNTIFNFIIDDYNFNLYFKQLIKNQDILYLKLYNYSDKNLLYKECEDDDCKHKFIVNYLTINLTYCNNCTIEKHNLCDDDDCDCFINFNILNNIQLITKKSIKNNICTQCSQIYYLYNENYYDNNNICDICYYHNNNFIFKKNKDDIKIMNNITISYYEFMYIILNKFSYFKFIYN